MKTLFFLLIVCLLAASCAVKAGAQDRFPRPEFQTDYEVPTAQNPRPRSVFMEYLDVGILLIFLALATFLALKVRSRTLIFWLMTASLLYFGFYRKGCICPVGSVQNLVLGLFDPAYTIPVTAFLLFLLPLVFSLLFGRTFCAAVCPLGAMQDLFLLRPIKMPGWLSRGLGVLPVLYLGLTVLFAATGAEFLTCRFDPFVTFFRFDGNFGVIVYSLIFLLTATVIPRSYCRFLCPYGLLLRLVSRFSRWHVKITPDECIQCRLCVKSCPFDAIRRPNAGTWEGEPKKRKKQAVRRTAVLLLLVPFIAFSGGWVFSRSAVFLSRIHETVRLAERINLEDAGEIDGSVLESETFRASGESTFELYRTAGVLRDRYRRGGWVLGGFLGLAMGLKLIDLSIRRRQTGYEPDRSGCFSCGRCFSVCPRERLRRKERHIANS